jgi:hypothetical protein
MATSETSDYFMARMLMGTVHQPTTKAIKDFWDSSFLHGGN